MSKRSSKDREETYLSASRLMQSQEAPLSKGQDGWARFQDVASRVLKVSKQEVDQKRAG
jgi:hypothetical protein